MAETTAAGFSPNPKIGSIEYVGGDGFIVESADPADPEFIGGKRIFTNFDELLRFMASYMKVYKSEGNTFGIRPKGYSPQEIEERRIQEQGGNGVSLSPTPEVQQEAR